MMRLSIFLAWLAFVSAAFGGGACSDPNVYVDDYPNFTAMAQGIVTGLLVHGEVEVFADRDVFSVSLNPAISYSVTLTHNTLDDSEVRVWESDGSTLLLFGSSAASGGSTVLHIPTGSVARTVYIDVRSLSEFFKGTYTLTVSELPWGDGDFDTLPDDWEMSHGLDDSVGSGVHGYDGDFDLDGLTNGEELRSGTDPNDPSSRLYVKTLEVMSNDDVHVTWPAVQWGVYQVLRTDSPLVAPIMLNESLNVDPSGDRTYIDVNAGVSDTRVYSIRFISD